MVNIILDKVYFSNSIRDYIWVILIFLGLSILFAIFYKIILRRLEKWAERTHTDIDNVLVTIFKSIRPPFYVFIALYFALRTLVLSQVTYSILNALLIVLSVFYISKISKITIKFIANKNVEGDNEQASSAVDFLNLLISIAIWSIGFLLLLSNLGVDVTSLIAGLGIGGVVIAFALQNILADLFSSFAIYFDKPFEIGDFIMVGDKMGTVEKIGIKTTRIRALQGEEIVFSNRELTSSQIQNFKKLQERRISFQFGIVYQTPTKKLRKIPEMIQEMFKQIENVRFDRTHFFNFGDSALIFEVVYYVLSADYNAYMDTRQEINLAMKEAFENEKIEFAYPTQTIYVSK